MGGPRCALALTLRAGVLASLVALVALEAAQVALRYGLSTGVPWGHDVGGLLLFSLAWLGLPLLWLQRGHLALTVPLPPRAARAWDRALDVLAILAGGSLLYHLWQAAAAFRFIEMAALGVDASIRTWPLMAGTALWILAAALNLAERRA